MLRVVVRRLPAALLCLALLGGLVSGVLSVAAPGVPNSTVAFPTRPSLATMEDGLPMLFGVAKLAVERERESAGSPSFKSSPEGVCMSELADVWRGIAEREMWALKMLDSSGTPGSGFLWGNNYWLGSRSMCRSLVPRAKAQDGNGSAVAPDGPPGEVEVFVASFRHRGSPQERINLPNEDLVLVALCAPNVCPEETLGTLVEESLAQRDLPLQRLLGLKLQLEGVRSLRWHPESLTTKPKFGIMAFVIFLLLFLMLAGTYYDMVIWSPALRKALSSKVVPMENIDLNRKPGADGSRPVDVELLVMDTNHNGRQSNNIGTMTPNKGMIAVELNKSPKQEAKEPRQGALGHFLMCFSVPRNTTTIFDTHVGEDSVCAIHGMRFIGMTWIIMVHSVYFLADYCDNLVHALQESDDFMTQIISNSTPSVDTFFFISGFLLAYLYFKDEMKNTAGKEQKIETLKFQGTKFVSMVVRRFLRLTPTYMVVLGIVDINMSWYSKTTFFTLTERADEVCPKYWWRNILYINNFFVRDEMCMSWSWYLSNDMQFFILGTFLLLLSSSYFVLSVIILVIILISSSVLTGYISFIYGYIPTLDEQLAMLSVLYDPPWTRIGPYLVGMCTGYYVVKLNGKLNISRTTAILLWVLGSTCNLSVLFGVYDKDISVTASAFYVALNRTVWSLGLAWILVACSTGYAGIIDSLLSFKGWIPLSRLTYGAYLLNPMLMNSIYLSSENAWHLDFLPLGAVFFGHLCMSYFCSYALSLAIESPSILLIRWLAHGHAKTPVKGRTT